MTSFFKYHGLGNDFVIIEGDDDTVSAEEVIAICDRHRGIGADGVLVIRRRGDVDGYGVQMIIYNRDGGRSEMCGNGVRCVAAFARRHWKAPPELFVFSDAGDHRCQVEAKSSSVDMVTVDMGVVDASPAQQMLEADGHRFEYVSVNTGNPHAVIFELPEAETMKRVGRAANDDHPLFSQGVNVEFATELEGDQGYRVVVYERGVGFTQACGTGACAVAEAAWVTQRMARDRSVAVDLPGGRLTIQGEEGRVLMTGMAQEVFSGRWSRD